MAVQRTRIFCSETTVIRFSRFNVSNSTSRERTNCKTPIRLEFTCCRYSHNGV
jgi:hypothetical protein